MASSSPPLGPALGQYQLPILDFCDAFNSASLELFEEELELRVMAWRLGQAGFCFVVRPPSLSQLLWQLGQGCPDSLARPASVTVQCLYDLVQLRSALLRPLARGPRGYASQILSTLQSCHGRVEL